MLRAYFIGVATSLALMAIVVGTATAIGVPEKWFGSLIIPCLLAGAFAGAEVLLREDHRHQR